MNLFEGALALFEPIPHWGRVHHFDQEQPAISHPKHVQARAVFDSLDPAGKFSSEYLRSLEFRR
ncbi:D-arabinono-1,4-lactone oxidase [Candidatus Aquiluna sp. UB-MaderosW2red]|uniref:D-arabinono-1,4-lactone oxidase n=1 Tax=Candidatus Aquiluna sp. UB-MaderosW2red TaxID=1855377 RepID=UPI0012FC3937